MRLAGKIATMARRDAPLPYEKELEYLQSDFNQFVRTGIVALDDVEIKMKFAFRELSNQRDPYDTIISSFRSGVGSTNYNFVRRFNNTSRFQFCAGSYTGTYSGPNIVVGQAYQVDIKFSSTNPFAVINETSLYYESPSRAPDGEYVLLATGQNGSNTSAAKIWRTEFYHGGSLIRDLVPVVAKFDGVSEACFFNAVYDGTPDHGDAFYRSAGSMPFIPGPEKS